MIVAQFDTSTLLLYKNLQRFENFQKSLMSRFYLTYIMIKHHEKNVNYFLSIEQIGELILPVMFYNTTFVICILNYRWHIAKIFPGKPNPSDEERHWSVSLETLLGLTLDTNFSPISIEIIRIVEYYSPSVSPILLLVVLRFDGRLQIFNLTTLFLPGRTLHLRHYIDAQEIRMEIRSISGIGSDRRIHDGISNRFQLSFQWICHNNFSQHSTRNMSTRASDNGQSLVKEVESTCHTRSCLLYGLNMALNAP